MKKINKNEKLNVLIFTAHPDDHLPCSGTLLTLKKNGFEVYECLFTNGETSGLFKDGKYQADINKNELKKVRSDEFKKASKILGTKNVFLLNQANNAVVRSYDLVLKSLEIIRKVRPFIVLFHGPNDYHPDHKGVYDVVSEALRSASLPKALEFGERFRVPIALCFDGLNMTTSQVIIDVSDVEEEKNKIVDCYKSQMPKGSAGYRVDGAISTYRAYQRGPLIKSGRSGMSAEGFSIPEKFPIAGDELFNLMFIRRGNE